MRESEQPQQKTLETRDELVRQIMEYTVETGLFLSDMSPLVFEAVDLTAELIPEKAEAHRQIAKIYRLAITATERHILDGQSIYGLMNRAYWEGYHQHTIAYIQNRQESQDMHDNQ